MKGRVSVLVPGRCEPYFQRTIDSALERARGDVEIVAVVDGPGQEPMIASADPRVKIIVLEKSIGQRAAYNLAVRESTGEFVMKIDAHALMSEGYDVELAAHCQERTVVLPEMRRLDVHTWQDKPRGKTHFMHIGLDLYCHFWDGYRKRPEAQAEYPDVMTGQGSCWFTTRDWNDWIGLLDERVGSWGNVGIEVSLRTWLCGGQQIVNKAAWQAHWFRKDEGGFTYPMDGRQVARAHNFTWSNYYFKDDAFEHQVRPFSWLIRKFAPVPGWEAYLVDEFKSPRVIVYYTDSQLDDNLAGAVRKQLVRACGAIPIISVSQQPLKFGKSIVVGEKPRSQQSMLEQILVGLRAAPEGSIVYLCEHDNFYHPSHFAFLPPEGDVKHAWFNTNRYHWRLGMPSFLKARGRQAYSQCVAYREMLIAHIEERLAECAAGKLEPMHVPFHNFASERPNVDIRHGHNLTPDSQYKRDWLGGKSDKSATIENLPGWGRPKHFMSLTGYKPDAPVAQAVAQAPVDTAVHLQHKFARSLPQVSPVRCIGFTRDGLAGLYRELGFTCGAEIGVREGVYSETLCRAMPGLALTCVDIWEPYPGHKIKHTAAENYAAAQVRLAPYGCRLVKAESVVAAQDVPDGSLDFVYVDACHDFDHVMQDLMAWVPKVRAGGIVSGHDYYRGRNSGVVPAVDAYAHAHEIGQWFITDEKCPSFFWVKAGGEHGLSIIG